jgi:hypothetical protein
MSLFISFSPLFFVATLRHIYSFKNNRMNFTNALMSQITNSRDLTILCLRNASD